MTSTLEKPRGAQSSSFTKFSNPDWTANGEPRARVSLVHLDTVWINTGSLCNITCRNCYIESSPSNDRLVYISAQEAAEVLHEAKSLGVREIGFTGGEPFLNPEFMDILERTLIMGFEALVLTNAMTPMQRPQVKGALSRMASTHSSALTIRVSLDHYTSDLHEQERGTGSWEKTLAGVDWLFATGIRVTIAGRSCWGEAQDTARVGYQRLFSERGWPLQASDVRDLVIFPEMDLHVDVPEITPQCWGILGKRPETMMCATSRMVIKRKGMSRPSVVPCTLLPYDQAFDMGATLKESMQADGGMFAKGAVKLCHPHCSKFCVLGGGSCS